MVTGVGVPGLCDTMCFNGYFIAGSSGTSVSHILSTGDHGATWSDTTLGHAVTRWYLSPNPLATTPHAVAIPRVYSTGIYFYTTDGHTWVTKSMPWGSSYAVGGICLTQDAAGVCLLVAVYNHGGGVTQFWRSADGATWTLQSTGPSGALYSDIADMACCGSLVVCTLADSSSGGPSGTWISPDGGVTWYFGQSGFGASAAIGFATYFQAHILSSGNQFMAYNNIRMRFSDACGLPAIRLA